MRSTEHKILTAYTLMALGLYHDNFTVEEAERGILTGEWATVERVLPFEIEKICAAKQISRNRFIKSSAQNVRF